MGGLPTWHGLGVPDAGYAWVKNPPYGLTISNSVVAERGSAKGRDAVFFLHTALVRAKMRPMRDDRGSEEQPAALRSGQWKHTET